MNMQLTKKAAKRYLADAAIPLSTAQEKISTYFGFANFDAAQKAIKDRSLKPAENGLFWCDLEHGPFRSLIEFLWDRARTKNASAQGSNWFPRSESLLKAVIELAMHDGCTIELTALERRLKLENIGEAFDRLEEAHGGDISSWPRLARGLGRYLAIGLPGYSLEFHEKGYRSFGFKSRFRSEQVDQHRYLLNIIYDNIITKLELMEEAGGTSKFSYDDKPLKSWLSKGQGRGESGTNHQLALKSFGEWVDGLGA